LVTHELILKVLNKLNKKDANTSLAMIGCIIKGDQNSICTAYNNFEEFGCLDEKSMKNLGVVFDDLIDKKLISMTQKGLQKRYELTEKGFKVLNDPTIVKDDEKYFSSVGTPSDFMEERIKLDTTITKIDNQISDIYNNKYYHDVKPSDTGSDFDEMEDLKIKKKMNLNYEKQMDELNELKLNPYFGRMDLIESSNKQLDVKQLYIGYKALVVDSNDLILDWRAKLAQYFYNSLYKFQVNNSSYELQLKRKIDIEKSQIKSIYNEVTRKKSELKDTISDPFLINVLKKKKNIKYFTDIIATIQEKQNEIIRLPLESNIIVQGCAGSGKTMILLHRLSYILYHHQKLNPDLIKIVTPSKMFDEFVADLSQTLGLNNIQRYTMVEMFIDHINQHFPQKISKSYKNELQLNPEALKIIYSAEFSERLISKIKQQMLLDLDLLFDINEKNINNKHKDYLKVISQKNSLIEISLKPLLNVIIKQIGEDQKLSTLINLDNINELYDEIVNEIRSQADIENKINDLNLNLDLLMNKKANIEEVLNDAFLNTLIEKSNAYRIKLFSSDKVSTEEYLNNYKNQLIQENRIEINKTKEEIEKYSKTKLDQDHVSKLKKTRLFIDKKVRPILDELNNYNDIINTKYSDEQFVYNEKINKLKNHISELTKYFDNYGENIRLIEEIVEELKVEEVPNLSLERYFEEILVSELEEIAKFYDIGTKYHNQFKYYYYLKLAVIHAFKFIFKPINLLMIDEAQEFSDMEYQLIKDIHPLLYMNFYGDVNQLTSHIGYKDWKNLKVGLQFYDLNENYRNPKPIVDYVNDNLDMSMVSLGLEFGKIESNVFPDITNVDAIIFNDIDKDEFISKHKSLISSIDTEKLIHINEAKGLEFNNVIVYTKNMTRNQKYIAFTRSLDSLRIIEDN
jgi:DNA helicase IV